MRLPTAKTLTRIGIDLPTAKRVRLALECCRESVNYGGCLGDEIETALKRTDQLIGGFGVDYIAHKDDGMRAIYGLDYVNMGETYKTTLIFNWATQTWCVCSWGNIVESAPESRYR